MFVPNPRPATVEPADLCHLIAHRECVQASDPQVQNFLRADFQREK